jgi:hypothetical protein
MMISSDWNEHTRQSMYISIVCYIHRLNHRIVYRVNLEQTEHIMIMLDKTHVFVESHCISNILWFICVWTFFIELRRCTICSLKQVIDMKIDIRIRCASWISLKVHLHYGYGPHRSPSVDCLSLNSKHVDKIFQCISQWYQSIDRSICIICK